VSLREIFQIKRHNDNIWFQFREIDGIPLLLDCCNIDARNPRKCNWISFFFLFLFAFLLTIFTQLSYNGPFSLWEICARETLRIKKLLKIVKKQACQTIPRCKRWDWLCTRTQMGNWSVSFLCVAIKKIYLFFKTRDRSRRSINSIIIQLLLVCTDNIFDKIQWLVYLGMHK